MWCVKKPNLTPANSASTVHELCESLPSMTKQHIVAKVGECYDPIGLVEPVKAFYKRSLTRINDLDWKDSIPDNERQFWQEILKSWPELAKVEFPRSTVPENAVYPLISRLIVCSDSSQDCGGTCAYLGYKLKNCSGTGSPNKLYPYQ